MKQVILIVFCLWGTSTFSQEINTAKNEISVTGEATVRVQPNQVILQLGAETRGKDLLKTKSKNSDIISKAIAYCKSKGIAEKHIQTDYIRMTPSYNYNSLGELNYYNVDQSLSITLEQMEIYEEILTELLKIGVNKVQGANFSTTDLKENRIKARKLAIEAAKEKAVFLASEVGIKLGKITNVSEYATNNNYFELMSSAAMSQNVIQNIGGDSTVQGLSVGMIPIRASITLTYQIK